MRSSLYFSIKNFAPLLRRKTAQQASPNSHKQCSITARDRETSCREFSFFFLFFSANFFCNFFYCFSTSPKTHNTQKRTPRHFLTVNNNLVVVVVVVFSLVQNLYSWQDVTTTHSALKFELGNFFLTVLLMFSVVAAAAYSSPEGLSSITFDVPTAVLSS